MAWTKQLSQLRDAMALQIPFKIDAIQYLNDAGINWITIPMSDNPITLWGSILSHTDINTETEPLIEALLKKFPKNPHLLSYKEHLDYTLGPELIEADWKEPVVKETLEKLTGVASTLLPISFLQMGIKMAKSVARVVITKPTHTEVGTGFLLPNNLFLTNNHVITDAAVAQSAVIQFDYEQTQAGLAVQPTPFQLDPANGFATSVPNDWTAVRVKGDANKNFGAIELKAASVEKNEFVNIIQHPGGQHKQIGMYHNMVTYSDNNIIQYLTDTEPGSSGSPVFNSQWQVVALHHSGGMLTEPGGKKTFLRNEGININVVIAGIKSNNL
jgi:V8-like Glu-specific endopeptidase